MNMSDLTASSRSTDTINEELLDFLEQCPTSYHSADTIRRILIGAGYEELRESASWSLVKGGRYFAVRGESSVIAFRIPHSKPSGFMIAASHTDSPALNKGPVLKYNASQRYTTDAVSAAVFKELCRRAGVPFQEFTNRSDIMGGSTLGHQSMTHVSIPTADVGLPQLAMHSAYETAGTRDTEYMIKVMRTFFSSSLESEGRDCFLIR